MPGQMLRLRDDPPRGRPRVEGLIGQIGKRARGRLRRRTDRRDVREVVGDQGRQPGVLREPDDIVDAVRFTPRQQRVATEARIGAHDNADGGPHGPQRRHDPGHVLGRPGTGVNIRRPQARTQQVLPREDVERQVAVVAVVAVKKAAFLRAVHGIIRSRRDRARFPPAASGAPARTDRRTAGRRPRDPR